MKKGFTLIELLIVIGILAILATAVVVVLNPAQLFAQARDSQRISDVASLQSALSYYLSTASASVLDLGDGVDFTCGTNYGPSSSAATSTWMAAATVAHAGVLSVTGTGWVAVNLGNATGGSPLSSLPADPTNSATYHYQYSCDNTARTFELDARMESARYAGGGSDDVVNTDGGNDGSFYEVGNDPGLNL